MDTSAVIESISHTLNEDGVTKLKKIVASVFLTKHDIYQHSNLILAQLSKNFDIGDKGNTLSHHDELTK